MLGKGFGGAERSFVDTTLALASRGHEVQAICHRKFEKREALENVLIPFTIEENIKMCNQAGFKQVSTVFQWANFVTFVAKK